MRCKYCNCLLEEYDKGICRWCGRDNNEKINNQNINKNFEHEHIKNEEFTTLNDDLITELMKDYIGQNYENLVTQNFSVVALLFGPYYIFYRKFFSLGITILILEFFLGIGIFSVTVVHIVSGFIFNKYYINHVKTKVTQYRLQYPNYSYEKLKGICTYNGGVSIGFIIYPIIVSIITITLLIFIGIGN